MTFLRSLRRSTPARMSTSRTRTSRRAVISILAATALLAGAGSAGAAPVIGLPDLGFGAPAAPETYFMQIHFHLDATHNDLSKCQETYAEEGSSGQCSGLMTDGHLAPFDAPKRGEAAWNYDLIDSQYGSPLPGRWAPPYDNYVAFEGYKVGPAPDYRTLERSIIQGTITSRAHAEFTVLEKFGVGNDDKLVTALEPGVSAGQKGGPLYLNVSARGSGYDFYVDGWLKLERSDPGTPAPSGGLFGS